MLTLGQTTTYDKFFARVIALCTFPTFGTFVSNHNKTYGHFKV